MVAVLIVIAGAVFWGTRGTVAPSAPFSDYKNGTYSIEGVDITLVNGYAETEFAPGSISRLVTRYFGNEATGDLTGDGVADAAFLLTQDGGGSGTFYYVVAALETPDGYKGTNAVFLGDRIAPQTTEIRDGEIIVNYADRNPGEPMTAQPSVGVSKYFRVENGMLVAVSGDSPALQASAENQGETGQPQSRIITDDFSLDIPAGWEETAPAMGASVMAVYANEEVEDPAARKINFKSYLAVSYDTLQGKDIAGYLQTVRNSLLQAIPSVLFTAERDMTVNGNAAHAIEAELTQQGADFKILIILISGEGEDIWVISFNTTKNGWDDYRKTFYDTANSFIVKK